MRACLPSFGKSALCGCICQPHRAWGPEVPCMCQALGRDADAGCPKAAEILAEQNAAELKGGAKANGLQTVSVAASSAPGKGTGADHRALLRMDSPDAEGGTSGDSHCSEYIMH